MKKSVVLHPILFAIFPALFLYTYNIGKLSTNVIFLPIAITVCLAALAWFLLSLILKDKERAGLLVSFFLLLFFSYGHLSQLIRMVSFEFAEGRNAIGTDEIFFFIWMAVLFLAVYFCIRARRDLSNLTRFLNAVAVILVSVSLINIGTYKFRTWGSWQSQKAQEMRFKDIRKTGRAFPNIYFIILDGYANRGVLKEIYDYDNSGFIDYLTGKGFYVANQSMSNYGRTALSLASCLNLRYLDYLKGYIDVESMDTAPLRDMIEHSRAFRFLRHHGYKIVAFSSGRHDTEIKNADVYITCGHVLDEFQNELINTTPIPFVLNKIEAPDQYDLHRKRLMFIIDHLADTCRMKGPVFVFAHIELPHPPFVFGRNGEEIDPDMPFTDHDGNWLIKEGGLTKAEYIEGYRNQLIFTNKKMEVVLDKILSGSKQPPIIIMQGDHGPRSMVVWEDPDKTDLKECLSILNAYYLPGNDYKDLYQTITPVNTFRVIFNDYFGTAYKLLKDKSYFSGLRYPYKFIEASDSIERSKPR